MATVETTPGDLCSAVPYRLKESRYGSHMLLLDALPSSGNGRRVLDLGCCNGYFAALLAERGYQVTGVERAEGHGPDFPAQVVLIEHDLEKGLPRIDQRFSFIVCADILEHLRNPLELLRQARELLEPDGQLAASLPNSGNFYFRLNVLAGRFPKEDKGLFDRTHVQFFPWSGWVQLLKDAGYRVICIDQKATHGFGIIWNHIPFGAEDQTGDRDLVERARWLKHCEFFIGLSSGLSWLAWGAGVPVVMISGFTHPLNEFSTPYRVINYHTCNSCWNDPLIRFDHKDFLWCPRHKETPRQFECSRLITFEHVKTTIERIPAFARYQAQRASTKISIGGGF